MTLREAAMRHVRQMCGSCIHAADDDCVADCTALPLRAALDDGVVVAVVAAPGSGRYWLMKNSKHFGTITHAAGEGRPFCIENSITPGTRLRITRIKEDADEQTT